MGCFSMFSSRRGCDCSRANTDNPDPRNFTIVSAKEVGKWLVAKIRYPNCSNFAGMKLLVFRDVTITELSGRKSIDPHFDEKGFAPFARFEPTEAGHAAALLLVRKHA